MEIVINVDYGGFGLSELAEKEYAKRKGIEECPYCGDIPRNDSDLIAVVRKFGEAANCRYSKLKIVEIPDGVDWEIGEYDGLETVEEKHRSWS